MENIGFLVVVVVLVINAITLFVLWKKITENKPKEDGQGMQLLMNQVNNLRRDVNENIKEIIEKVTRVDETGKQMIGFADQLEGLQDMLKNPKQRGVLGEYYLETLLKNVLPPGSYEMQYDLGINDEGERLVPDAVVFVKDKIIPVDSKFSLENYNRLVEEKDSTEKMRLEKLFVNDLKNRITETSKYIRPEKGTMDFAFMFIPHEAIYYDLIVNKIGALKEETESLVQRAASKYKVIIVSPTSFLAYLQTVLQGLKAMHIEEQALEIKKNVENLIRHIGKYDETYKKLGNTLGTAINHYNSGYKELSLMDKDFLKITGSDASLEPLTLDKPSVE